MCVCVCSAVPRKERRIKQKKRSCLRQVQRKYYLTFKLKMVLYGTVSIQKHPHQYAYQQGVTIHCCYDILCTALFKALFHVPLLYFEHLPLQRSLHGPGVCVCSRARACVCARGWAGACAGGVRFSNSSRIIPSDYRILLLLKMPIPSIYIYIYIYIYVYLERFVQHSGQILLFLLCFINTF